MFESKDDEAWLKGLLEKEEISAEQYEWLFSLFSKKAESDKDNHADAWWKSIHSGNLESSFDPSAVPEWIKEHKHEASSSKGSKDHSFEWSWQWEGKDADPAKLAERLEEAKKGAAEQLEDAKAEHAERFNNMIV